MAPQLHPPGAAQKFWNIVDVSDEEAEITMYGEVGEPETDRLVDR